MIEKIRIQNFKSLADVTLKFTKFTCFVGMNGAGKSSILQALDFISQQMQGDLSGWLEGRGWIAKDIAYKGERPPPRLNATVAEVYYRLSDGQLLRWVGFFNRTTLQMVSEIAELKGERSEELLRNTGKFYRVNEINYSATFNYQGSILSQLRADLLPAPLLEFRDAVANIQSLELLSPNLLRKSSRSQDKSIGVGGEKLAGFLDTIRGDAKKSLIRMLRKFYPALVDFKVVKAKGGWKRLVVSEERTQSAEEKVTVVDTGAAHLNDGLLRILAILAQIEARNFDILLLDEVEDGINPEIVERLVDQLVQSPVQVIVTTHSPMILNYLADSVAKDAVQFVYKSPDGQTHVRPFFSLHRMDEKLRYMGPGEAFVDTSLAKLAEEYIEMDEADLESQCS